MKVNEIVNPSLDEGWKEKLAAIGVAGALGVGGAAYDYAKDPANGPELIKKILPKKQPSTDRSVGGPVQNLSKDTKKDIRVNLDNLSSVLPGPAQLLTNHAMAAGIKGEELIQLLAQAQHETLNFTRTEESGSKRYFKKYDPAFNPRKAKILGNTKAGDGEKYKGRGFLQITGRWNYKAAGKALGLPLEHQPELVNNPEVAAKVSVWYWKTFVKPDISNFKDVTSVTKEINPGLKGLDDREQKFNSLMKVAMR